MNNVKPLLDYLVAFLDQTHAITLRAHEISEIKGTIELFMAPVPGTKVVAFVAAPMLAPPVEPEKRNDEAMLRRNVTALEQELRAERNKSWAAESEVIRLKDLVRGIYRASKPIIDKEVGGEA